LLSTTTPLSKIHTHPPTQQAIDFTDKHGEVCPAGWKPGKRTLKADPVESLAYFEAVAEEEGTNKKSKH
jgi:hypothetical protein